KLCDQGLVRGDDCLSVLDARTNYLISDIRAAHSFHHDVNVIGIHDLFPVRDYGDAIHAGLRAACALSAKPGHADGDAIGAPPNLFGVERKDFGGGPSYGSVANNAHSDLSGLMKRSRF